MKGKCFLKPKIAERFFNYEIYKDPQAITGYSVRILNPLFMDNFELHEFARFMDLTTAPEPEVIEALQKFNEMKASEWTHENEVKDEPALIEIIKEED
jgi:hypothetical protein